MKLISLMSFTLFIIISSGCSTNKEDCSYNGRKVNCSEMPANKVEQRSVPKPAPASVEVATKGRYNIKDGQFVTLTDFKKSESKIIDGNSYSCEIELLKNTIVGIRADERELFLIKDGQENSYQRIENSIIDMNNLIIGTFEDLDTVNKIRFTMKFSSTTDLEIKSICYFN